MKRFLIFIFCVLSFGSANQVFADEQDWSVNPHDFQYDMTVYFKASLYNDDLSNLDNYIVAAFCGDECRGITAWQTLDGTDVKYGYLRIRSNVTSGESITFKLYDKVNDKVVRSDSIVSFKANECISYPSVNYKINFGNRYTITATSDNSLQGSVHGGGIYESDSQVTLLATPTEGHHFVQWSNGVTDNPYVFIAEKDTTVSASFAPNSYKLTYKVDGETYKEYTLEYGSTITPEAEPTKEGYTFSGWSEIPATMPANDVEVTGSFSINQYTVKFIVDGITVQEQSLDYGSAITKPKDPTKEGYAFTGWSPEVEATVPAHDVIYTAQFSINSYKLTYKVDGETYKEYTLEYGSTITPEAEPTKEGYKFSGWSEIPDVMPSHDVEVIGSFTLIPTAIQNIMADNYSDIKYYDLQGNRLEYPKNGINIVNGKKILIR